MNRNTPAFGQDLHQNTIQPRETPSQKIYSPDASPIKSLETSKFAMSENYKNEHDLLTLVLQEKVSGLEAENKKLKNPWLFVGK
jgi:isopenicillin N synthase-like dioxygenase